MRRHIKFLTAIAGLIAAPALAQDQTIDVNRDGNYSIVELQVAMPELTVDSFAAMDANGDGLLDAKEIAIATEAGLLPEQQEN